KDGLSLTLGLPGRVESDKEPNMSCFKNSNNKRSEPVTNSARSESNAAKEGGMDSAPAAKDGYKGSEYAPTYEDKDGDWMLVGDVPW
nr:auxin-induced protein [Tanacetum cinerariifolium]